jgi:hypothetical protein
LFLFQVELTEEAIKLSIADTDAADGKKKKKKVVKKKKKEEEKKELKKPEITTWLRNMVTEHFLTQKSVVQARPWIQSFDRELQRHEQPRAF